MRLLHLLVGGVELVVDRLALGGLLGVFLHGACPENGITPFPSDAPVRPARAWGRPIYGRQAAALDAWEAGFCSRSGDTAPVSPGIGEAVSPDCALLRGQTHVGV
jgi:hypothetical protein